MRVRQFFICLKRDARHHLKRMISLFTASALLLGGLYYFLMQEKPSADQASGGESASIQSKSDAVPAFLRYKISLTAEGSPLLIGLIKAQLQNFALISEVYLDDEETGEKRLEDGQTLLHVILPPDFLERVSTGEVKDPIIVKLSTRMPEEAMRVAPVLKNMVRTLSLMHASAFAWQALYAEYTGDEDGSWNKLTRLVLGEIDLLGNRRQFIRIEEVNPFVGMGFYLSAMVMLFSLIPALLLLDIRGRERSSPFGLRLEQAGADKAALFSHLILSLLFWLMLILPAGVVLALLLGLKKASYMLGLGLGCTLLASLFSAALAHLDIKAGSRCALGWLLMLLALFFAGAVYPTELFPRALRTAADWSPFRGFFAVMLKLAAAPAGQIQPALWPWASLLLPYAAALIILGMLERRSRV